jgi:hypothetical protein
VSTDAAYGRWAGATPSAAPLTPVGSLQRALAGDHAALYLLGVLGGRVSDSAQPRLAAAVMAAYVAHRHRRDRLTALVRDAGGQPVAAEVSYRLPNPCRTPAQLRAAGRLVERRCAAVYVDAAGATSGDTRAWAVDALTDCAVRELAFGATPAPWPGLPGL